MYILPPSNDIYKSQISFDDHLLAISTYATRHNISDTEFEHLLYLINLHLPDNNFLERNINKIKEKCGFYDDNLKLFTFCSVCENVFSNGVDRCQTPGCNTTRTQNYFVTGNLQNQLRHFLERKGVLESIHEGMDHVPNTITDIADGTEYKKLKEKDQFLSNENNVTFSLFRMEFLYLKAQGFHFGHLFCQEVICFSCFPVNSFFVLSIFLS